MARLYITKWVIARGILVTEAEIEDAPTPRGYIQRAWVNLPGMRYGSPLLLGREIFLDLKEARADAKKRFRAALKVAEVQFKYLTEAKVRLERDELLVHKKGAIVKDCHAFKVHFEEPTHVERVRSYKP
jgi:hypothetical protein